MPRRGAFLVRVGGPQSQRVSGYERNHDQRAAHIPALKVPQQGERLLSLDLVPFKATAPQSREPRSTRPSRSCRSLAVHEQNRRRYSEAHSAWPFSTRAAKALVVCDGWQGCRCTTGGQWHSPFRERLGGEDGGDAHARTASNDAAG